MPKHTNNRNNNGPRKGNNGRYGKSRRNNRALVHTIGANEPQSYPFTPDTRASRRALRFVVTRVQADAAGNFLHRVSMRNLARAFDGAGTYEDAASLSNVYDVYRPMYLRIKLVPVFATATFGVGSVILSPDYEDLDLSQVVNTVTLANQYNERKVLDPRFMSETTFKIPMLQSGSIPGTVSTSPAVIQAGGYLDFQAPPYDGVVYIVGSGFPVNLAVFDVYLEMDILLKFAR